MMIDNVVCLFQTYEIVMVVAALFMINVGVTAACVSIEVALDLLTKKENGVGKKPMQTASYLFSSGF
jgi:hypothetical protein